MFPFQCWFIFIESQTAPTMARIWFFALSFLCDSIITWITAWCRLTAAQRPPKRRSTRDYDMLFVSHEIYQTQDAFISSFEFFHVFRSPFVASAIAYEIQRENSWYSSIFRIIAIWSQQIVSQLNSVHFINGTRSMLLLTPTCAREMSINCIYEKGMLIHRVQQ